MGVERREHDRKTIRGPARLTIAGKPFMVRMLDVSVGGVMVASTVNLPLKQTLKLEFNILVRKSGVYTPITAAATIAYSAFSSDENGFKLGLQFAALSDAYKLLIMQYVGPKKSATPVTHIPIETFDDGSQ